MKSVHWKNARSNPVHSKADWDRQRTAATLDPGAFHGDIARREIFWLHPDGNSWIKRVDGAESWVGYDTQSGRRLIDVRLPDDFKPWEKDFEESAAPFYEWYLGGKTNACFNEVDVHFLAGHGNETAFIFEGEAWNPLANGGRGGPVVLQRISRKELFWEVAKHAVVLKKLGLKTGDRLVLNMPNIPEQVFYMEAAKRLGVIFTPVFCGFSSKTLAERIADSGATVLITCDGGHRNGQPVAFKQRYVDGAVSGYVGLSKVTEWLKAFFELHQIKPEFAIAATSDLLKFFTGEIAVARTEVYNALRHILTAGGHKDFFQKITRNLTEVKSDIETVIVVDHGGMLKTPLKDGKEFKSADLLIQAQNELAKALSISMGASLSVQSFADLSSVPESSLINAVYSMVPPVPLPSDFPLFIMYTSGSTGKPKGVVHTHGGYVAGIAHTMRIAFGVVPGDGQVMYVIADPSWITGQSYMISAALTTRTTSILAEGAPIYPDAGRFASIIERYQVTILKAGSTFLKAIAADPQNVAEVRKYDVSTLRVATFCAEPTSPEIQEFGMKLLTPEYGNSYWATEHGGIVLTNFLGSEDFKLQPDAHTYPLPWIFAEIWVAEKSFPVNGVARHEYRRAALEEKGEIVITRPYPYLARTIWGNGANVGKPGWQGDIARFKSLYFERWSKSGTEGRNSELVFTQGDYACGYENGSMSLHGRSDEVINTQGHRVGTEEIESAILRDKYLTLDSPIGNAVVVGCPHPEMGTIPVAFILVREGRSLAPADEARLNRLVLEEKGEFAIPAAYICVAQFPETRSGKYMRRFLKAILEGVPLGDLSAIRNPEALEEIQSAVDSWKIRLKAVTDSAEKAEGELIKQLQLVDPAQKRQVLEHFLRETLGRVLAAESDRTTPIQAINFAIGLREIGLTSLKGLRFTNSLRRALGQELGNSVSATLVFNYPTLDAIADFLAGEVLGLSPSTAAKPVQAASIRAAGESIAVVGMACRFPGGVNSPEDFWELLRNGKDATTEIPKNRWDVEQYFSADPLAAGKMYVRRGGFVDGVDRFDPLFFGISPREAVSLDPQHRLLLEVSWEALERSGYAPEKLVGSQTGVFVGITTREYSELLLKAKEHAEYDSYIPTGTNLNVASGRISYTLGLQGPAMSVDTACSSSLVAMHLACQSLLSGESDLALAGGVNLILTPEFTIQLCRTNALSPGGLCKTFDAEADGYVRSDGCGVLVLKRLSDVGPSEQILAVIRSSAVNQDGKSSGLTAPNGLAQEALIRSALAKANLLPTDISYVEAHGTGTPLGDPIEVQALGKVYGEGRAKESPLQIGSVKTNIGHAESAAGVAGVIKTILSLQHGQIPAHLHFKKINPHVNMAAIPATIPTKLTEWTADNGKRIAGVSSFGFSGTNAHLLLQEAPSRPLADAVTPGIEKPFHVLCLSAKTRAGLKELVADYNDLLARKDFKGTIGDVCFTAGVGRTHFSERLSVTGESLEQLQSKLASYLKGEEREGVVQAQVSEGSAPKVAFLFSGQGSQYSGMARELYGSEPTFKKSMDECAEILKKYLELPILPIIFDEAGTFLQETRFTQSALFMVEYSLYQLWKSWGVVPQAVLGHSVGEVVAACVAGVFSLADGLKLIAHRGALMQKLPGQGGMAAIAAGEERVRQWIARFGTRLSIAALNGPESVTLAGEQAALEEVCQEIELSGVKVKRLVVSHAFHSAQMDGMLDAYERIASEIQYHAPTLQLISNLTGERVSGAEVGQAGYWRRHAREAVRFSDGMKRLYAEGCRIFVEIGAGTTLVGMGQHCVPEAEECAWLPTLKKGRADWEQLMETVGSLYARGINPDWRGMETNTPTRRKLALPTYPFQRQRYWPEKAPNQKARRPDEHPFLGYQLRSSSRPGETIFESEVNLERQSFLRHHLVYGKVVVPGATYLDMAVSAAQKVFSGLNHSVEDLVIKQPLIVGVGETRLVQLVISSEEKSGGTFQILSRRNGSDDSEWVPHVLGRISLAPMQPTPSGEIEILRRTCSVPLSVAEHYSIFQDLGIDYGASFKVIQTLAKGEDGILGLIRLPEEVESESGEYQIHPVLLDGCLQMAKDLFIRQGMPLMLYLPFGMERFTFHRRPEGAVWCHMVLRRSEGTTDKMVNIDFQIFDARGRIVAEAIGYTAVEAPKAAVLRALQGDAVVTSRDWLYEVKWEAKSNPAIASREIPKLSWLLLGDQIGVATKLAEKLRRRGDFVTLVYCSNTAGAGSERVVDPLKSGELRSLLEELGQSSLSAPALQRIVHLWTLDVKAPQIGDGQIEEMQKKAFGSALALTQAILGSKIRVPVYFVTRGAVASGFDATPLSPAQATVWGLGRALTVEHPELQCIRVDLDPAEKDLEKLASLLAEELIQNGDHEEQVVLRGDKRLVPRLERCLDRDTIENTPAVQIKTDGTYLVTGGLGALGLRISEWLVQSGAKHLVLLGRNEPSANAVARLNKLRDRGVEIRIGRVDVARFADLNSAFESMIDTMPVLRGIIHAAGMGDMRFVFEETWEGFTKVLSGKVRGAWNLHCLSQGLKLDFFCLFSSGATLMPAPGQASYAAANLFLDTLAHERVLQGLPALSVNWGTWAEEGMASQQDGNGNQRDWAKGGMALIPLEAGFDLFGRLLARVNGQVAVLPVNWGRYLGSLPGDANTTFFTKLAPAPEASRPILAEAQTQKVAAASATDRTELVLRLDGAIASERRGMVMSFLQAEVSHILRLDAKSSVDPRKGLMTLGMDSLMAVEFRNRLKKALGASYGKALPATLLFQYPNLESLGDFLLNKVLVFSETPGAVPVLPLVAKKRKLSSAENEPIAITGMSCRFPGGANNLDAYWKMLAEGRSGLCEIPKSRWDINQYYDADPDADGKMCTRIGGFLKGVELDQFDREFFGVAPLEAKAMDPQLRLLLEVSWEALENAGESAEKLYGSQTGIFVGAMWDDYLELAIASNDPEVEMFMGTLASISALPGRLAYFLGFQGPNLLCDTACSSSLVSLHLACQSLRSGSCDQALAAGVNILASPQGFIRMSRLHALSPTGRSLTFDAKADGYVRAEGCGVLVLKRLSDAMANGDEILALVRGSEIGHGGRSISPTAPNGQSQEMLIRKTLVNAGVQPADIGYLEAHGTATPLGDPIEVQAAAAVLKEGRTATNPLLISSIKTNFGHAEGAAGVAGVIKTVLALRNRQIPPHLNLTELNPNVSLADIPAIVPLSLTDWTVPAGKKRLAGVSSFGMTGIIAHTILEEAPAHAVVTKNGSVERAVHTLCLSGRNKAALKALARRYVEYFTSNPAAKVGDVCFTAGVGRTHFSERLSVTGESLEQLQSKLASYLKGEEREGVVQAQVSEGSAPKVAFLFSGQGSQYSGMARELYGSEPTFKKSMDECAEILKKYLELPILPIIFDEAGTFLQETRFTQPALFMVEYSLYQLWKSWGVVPQAVLGHSVGEVVAACVAGVFSLADGLKLIAHRGALMQKLPGQGGMAAIAAGEERVRQWIARFGTRLSIAALNGPESVTLAGEQAALEEVCQEIELSGVKVKRLVVSHAFHSAQMDGMLDAYERIASEIQYHAPTLQLISNLTGERVSGAEVGQAGYWRRHAREAVRFSDGMKRLYAEGCRIFVEIGAGTTLVGMGQHCVPEAEECAWLPTLKKGRADWEQLMETVGSLYARGINPDWRGMETNTPTRRKLALPTYPFQRQRYWLTARKPAPLLALRPEADPAQWLYEVNWEKKDRTNGEGEAATHGFWLLLADRGGVAALIGEKLRSRGDHVTLVYAEGKASDKVQRVVDPLKVGEYASLYTSLLDGLEQMDKVKPSHQRVVHFWSLDIDAAATGSGSIDDQMKLGFGSALSLVQAVLAGKSRSPLHLITQGGVSPIPGEGGLSAFQAPIWGLGRAMAIEHPELSCRRIDLDPALKDRGQQANAILAEILGADGEDQVAFRGNERFVPRLEKKQLESFSKVQVSNSGTYMITGGLGALGLRVAEWLVSEGAKNLVLFGRREPSAEAHVRLDKMRETGVQIKIAQVDVSHFEEIKGVFLEVQNSMPPVLGIVHAAGMGNMQFLTLETWQGFQNVMSGKVGGAWNLHLLSRELKLDFFCLFSSGATLMPAPGQASYASSNLFLDVLASDRRSQGLPGLSINWGTWADEGMAFQQDENGQQRDWSKGGMGNIPLRQGIELLGKLLAGSNGQVAVLPVDWPQYIHTLPEDSEALFFSKVTDSRPAGRNLSEQSREAAVPSPAQSGLIKRLQENDSHQHERIMTDFLVEEIRAAIGKPPGTKLSEAESFASMGVDSLIITQLRRRLQKSLDGYFTIPVTAIFERPSIAVLSKYLVENVKINGSRPLQVPPRKIAVLSSVSASQSVKVTDEIWLQCEKPNEKAELRLFCFPYAGAGASMFADLHQHLPEQVEVLPVQLPGRWNRLGEPGLTDVNKLVVEMHAKLAPFLDRPVAVMGCCYGALIAFEWVRLLRRLGFATPVHFYVVAANAPTVLPNLGIHQWPDSRIFESYAEMFATVGHSNLLEAEELYKVLLPAMRADMQAFETYTYTKQESLDLPISVYGSKADPFSPLERLEPWAEQARTHYSLEMFEGNHYFYFAQKKQLLERIQALLERDLAVIRAKKAA